MPAKSAALASAKDDVGLVINRKSRMAASLMVASDNPAWNMMPVRISTAPIVSVTLAACMRV